MKEKIASIRAVFSLTREKEVINNINIIEFINIIIII